MSVPLLAWGPRPAGMKCACGREPLCGFMDAERTAFYGSCCYDDGSRGPEDKAWRVRNGVPLQPHFRSPGERERILRGGK